ncbi:MAG TPA: VWA domain-containing protein [Saprospiraceae bacterium]|nr:VWA domain-containing protein [Saprospiraceae bacterium]
MFRFENMTAMYLLLLIPLLGLVWYWAGKKRKSNIATFSNPLLFDRLQTNKTTSHVRFFWWLLAILLLIFALVNPQLGAKREKAKVENIDIMIALDISNSMNARDVSPSRLERAKKFITDLIQSRKGDQIGLIFFAGSAYLQMPLTSDYAAAEMFAKTANSNMAGTQGTAIGEAIDLAMRSVKEVNQRALIIISDGEDHDEDALNLAAKAKDADWTLLTVAVGTEEGGMVPSVVDGQETYKTDEDGNPVRSIVNQKLLEQIADEGNGKFYVLNMDENKIVDDMQVQLEKIQKRAVEIKSYTEFRSFYQYFLFGGIIILVFWFFYYKNEKVVQ